MRKSVPAINGNFRFVRSASLLALSLLCATGAQAANWAWSTAPGSATFAGNNWTSGTVPGAASSTPGSGDSLYFGTSSMLGLTNNDSGFTFAGLTFNSGANAFTLTGNAFTLATGSGVTNNSAAAQSITNVISGAGNVVQAGTGSLTLSGANTYSAGTIVSAGTLVANSAGSLGLYGPATVNGTLDLNAGAATYTGLTNGLSGNGTVNVVVSTGSANSILTTAYGNYANFTGTINIGTNGITGASSAAVSGSGKGVIFANMGAATINVLSNATLYVSGTVTDAASAVLYGGTTGEAFGQLRLDGSVLWTGPISLAGNIAGGSSGTIGGNSGTPTITGNITETGGSMQFVKIGGANLVLSGTNLWTGPTIVNGGTLTLLGNQTNYGGIYVGTNTTANALSIGTTTQTSPTTLIVASNATVVTASGASQYSTINVYGASGIPTYVTNNGTMSIGRDSGFGVNNYATWVQNSNLTVQANGGFPGNFLVAAGGTYIYNGVNPAVISAPGSSGSSYINVQGSFYTATNFAFNDAGSTGYPYFVLANGGTLTLGNNLIPLFASIGGTGPLAQVQVGTNGTLNTAGYSTSITNVIANASGVNGSLVVSGGGKVTLSGLNTYTGGTIVTNNTTLVLAAGGSTGAIRNNLSIYPGAVVALTAPDAMGYPPGVCVTNVNIYGGMLTNAGASFYESPAAYYNLSGGTVASAGGPFSFGGLGIVSLSNSVLSVFSAPVRFGANSTLTLNAAAGTVPGGVDLRISSGIYQGAGVSGCSVIKTGAGVVQLNAINSYNGSTFVNAGTLALGASATIPNTTNIVVASGATLDLSAVSSFTLGSSQALEGSGTVKGSVTDSGGSQFNPGGIGTVGTLTITGNLTLAGGDTLNYDFLKGSSNDVINVSGAVTPNGTTTINLANWPTGGFVPTSYVLIQAASLGGSAGNFTLANAPTGGRQTYNIVYNTSSSPQQVLLQVSGYNANLVWVGGSGNAWDIQITQDWLNNGVADSFYTSDSVLFSNVPPANTSVVITPASVAPGTVTFNSTNNYVFSGTGGYITGSASLTKNGIGSVTLTTANDYTGGTTINNGSLQLGDGMAYDGSVAGNIVNNSALVVSNSSVEVYNNNISGSGWTIAGGSAALTLGGNISGSGQIVVTGSGGLTLNGTNSYTGGTIVSNGVLSAVNTTSLGVPSSPVIATVQSSGVLQLALPGSFTLTNQIVGSGSLAYSNGNPGTAGQPLNYGLVGLTLPVSNNFSGGLTINVGSVYAYNNHALGTGPVTIDNGNGYGTYGYNQLFVGNGRNISNAITVVNASDYYDGVLMVDPGPNNSYGASDTNGGTFSGPITVASGTIAHGSLFCGPGGGTNWLVIAGPVTNLNGGIASRNGRTRFSGGGSYSSFYASGGVVQIGANNGIATNATLQIAGGSFDLNGYSQTLTGLGNPGGGLVVNSSTNASTLTLDLSSESDYSSVISGNVALVENGSATLNLSGTNTYTGATVINSGTLTLSGYGLLSNTPSIYVSSIATLDAAGTSAGGLTINRNQTLKGDGAFNINGTLTSLGTIELKANSSGGISPVDTSDSVNGSYSIVFGGTLKLDLSGSPLTVNDSFTLFNFPGGNYSGAFTNIIPATPGPGLTWDTNNLANNGTLAVQGGGIATNPTNIIVSLTGNTLNLSWPGDHLGWLVQSNSVGLAAPAAWQDLSNTASGTNYSIIIDPRKTNVFYRLREP